MNIYALYQISDGLVIDKIIADSSYIPPEGYSIINIDNIPCDIGWIFNGNEFLPKEIINGN